VPGVGIDEAFQSAREGNDPSILEHPQFDHHIRVDVLDVVDVGDALHAADEIR